MVRWSSAYYVLSVALLGVCARASLVGGRGSDADPIGLGPLVWGGNIHFTAEQPGEMAQLAQALKIVRMDFSWARTETERGVYNFSSYDQLLTTTRAHGVRNYWILDFGNSLYSPGAAAPATPEAVAAFARWSVAAMTHFRGQGIIFELYNEPNIPTPASAEAVTRWGTWSPVANASAYMDLYDALIAAKQAAGLADVPLVAPALAGVEDDFLTTCFERGMLETVDGLSLHPYRVSGPETVIEDSARMHLMIRNYTTRDVPVVSGEWGYSTCTNGSYVKHTAPIVTAAHWAAIYCDRGATTGPNTQSDQAKFLARQWLVNAMLNIPVSIFYEWRNGGDNKTYGEDNFGIVEANYVNMSHPFVPKVAYAAASTLQSQINSSTFSQRLPAYNSSKQEESDEDIFVLAFANATRLAVWKIDGDTSCDFVPRVYTDCGFYGITEAQCLARNCCFSPKPWSSEPECNFPPVTNTSGSITLVVSPNATYTRIAMLGTPLTSITADAQGQIRAVINDEPQYWTLVSTS
ncbi:uncharacterized protein MONBRDRAFT_24381 [Monosiga brevicollis MX1]|uniref:P-type domain-containing protein n=1 Tax=Monosiga brevicollis TaxID=81824 RepID=A9UW89_MONBE|nr:uncharacterized protein MONBRDRAFT_24381 [Monosiga brevicollis MX1]EDQ90723.1 predicted protein [Monosiga brevicollis MX1]|eukprot:XP_001744774.1 hypothetical protein [Monosiga brevicollis MX1]